MNQHCWFHRWARRAFSLAELGSHGSGEGALFVVDSPQWTNYSYREPNGFMCCGVRVSPLLVDGPQICVHRLGVSLKA